MLPLLKISSDGKERNIKTCKAKLIDSLKRGEVVVTERRLNLLKEGKKIDKETLMRYDEFKEFYQRGKKSKLKNHREEKISEFKLETSKERMEKDYREIMESLAQEILDKFLEVSFDILENIS